MRAGNTAKALCQNHISTAMNHAVRLKRSRVSGHGAGDIVIANFRHQNFQMFANGAFVHLVVNYV
jgi:hypothetical protein